MIGARRFLIGLVTAAVVVSFAPAAGAVGWVSSPPLSPPDRFATEPQIVVAPGGERVVAWLQELADGNGTPENISVRIAPPGGDFGPIQTLPATSDRPVLAVGSDGTVGLAWLVASTRTLHVARLTPGTATFAEATPLTVGGGETPQNLHASVDGGDIFVSFDSRLDNSTSIWAATLRSGSGAVQLLPGTATGGALDHQTFTAQQPVIFVDSSSSAAADGRVNVAWQQEGSATTPSTTTVKFDTLGSNGQFGAPTPVDTEFSFFTEPQVAAGGGHVYLVWSRAATATAQDSLVVKDLTTAAPFQPIPTDPSFELFKAAVDSSGTLYVAGQGNPPGTQNTAVSEAIIPTGAIPGPALRLTPVGIARQFDALAVASDGTALILPDRVTSVVNGTMQVFGSLRPARGGFGAPLDISGIQDGPQDGSTSAAAVLPGGAAFVAWTASDHSGTPNARVHVSELDNTPPTFGTISVPATATVGQRLQFSASASDALSNPATIAWDFGDGAQAMGPTASRTFGTSGTKLVRITASDAYGNSTTVTRAIAVRNAAAAIDRTPPSVTRLSVSPSRFRVGTRATARLASQQRSGRAAARKSAPIGTAVRLSLSERATLVIDVHHGRADLGTLVRASARPGNVTIAFSGRIGGAALAPATYTATVTAIDPAGNRSVRRTVRFTIVGN